MELSLTALANGVAVGSVAALLALSISQLFAVTGVVSFAQAGFAMVGAYVYASLTGDHGWSTWFAAVVAVLAAAALGAFAERAVYRRAARMSGTVKFVIGVALLSAVEGAVILQFGATQRSARPLLGGASVDIAGVGVSRQQLVILAITTVLVAGLLLQLRYTRFGLATRATVEDRQAAEIVGVPSSRVSSASWTIGSGVAGLAGVLLAPLTPFGTSTFLILLVTAFSATIIGGLRSLVGSAAGGLLIGFIDTSFTLGSGPEAALLAVFSLTAAFVLFRRRWPTEITDTGDARTGGIEAEQHGPPAGVRIPARLLLAGGWLSVVLAVARDDFWGQTGTLVFVYVLGTLAVAVVSWSGQISLAHGPLVGVGAFSMLYLGAEHDLGYWPALALTLLIGAVAGVVISLLTLRTPPVLTAIFTLVISMVATGWLLPKYSRDSGIIAIPDLFSTGTRLFVGAAVATGFVAVCLFNLRRGVWGPMLLAVRKAPRMAPHFAISESRTRLYMWAVSGSIAALAGTFYAYFLLTVTNSQFGLGLSISLLLYATVGGTQSLVGPFIAPLVFVAGPQALTISDTDVGPTVAILSGLAVMYLLAVRPNGLAELLGRVTVPSALPRRRVQLTTATSAVAAATVDGQRAPGPDPTMPPLLNGRIPSVAPPNRPLLHVQGMSVHLDRKQIIHDLSLRAMAGTVTAVIGANGAGKTTVLNAISGACPHSDGSVVVDGTALPSGSPSAAFRHGVARTFQNLELVGDLSVLDNVAIGVSYGARATLAEAIVRAPRCRTDEARIQLQAEWALSAVDLRGDATRPVGQLPYGVRRRVEIARAIASRPKVLLLDEPTAGMDPVETRAIGELVRHLARAYDIATLLVEHDELLVHEYADQVYVLQLGRVVAVGDPDEILTGATAGTARPLGSPEIEHA